MIDPICKFNHSKANAINCSQFVFETTDAQRSAQLAPWHYAGIVLSGGGVLCVSGECSPLVAGDVYFVKKGSVFSLEPTPDTEYFYIAFHGWHADELIDRVGVSRRGRVFGGHSALADFWQSCFERSDSGNLDLFSEAALLYTVASLARTQKEKDGLSARMCEYTAKHFSSPALSLAVLGSELGYDPKYLSAVFKAEQHVTFTAYLKGLRIRHAAFLFDEGVESVKVVAMLSGFSDALYFSRIFKQETGMTPSEYIKRASRP